MNEIIENMCWFGKITLEFIWALILVIFYILKGCKEFFYVPLKDVSKETVVLTGAAGGFGTLIANKMAEKGCKMVLLDINEAMLNQVCQDINKKQTTKNNAVAFRCDITKKEEVHDVCKAIRKEVGNPTILINNAGIVAGKYLSELEFEDTKKTFEVNVLSNFIMIKELLPSMLEQNHGHIVSIASILGMKGLAGVTEYCASKAAAVSLMSSIRREIDVLDKNGVHCTTVLPYQVSTQLFKGCAIRFKWFPFLNILDPDYVTDKIISAIQRNQITLYVPRILYFLVFIQHILPERAVDMLYDFLGADLAMKTFVGRQKSE